MRISIFSVILLSLCLQSAAFGQDVPRVTIEAEKESLSKILKDLGKKHGLNYVASRAALEQAGEIDCRLMDVPIDRAVQMLCAACSLEAEIQGRFVIIRPAPGKPRFAFPANSEAAKAPAKVEKPKKAASEISKVFKKGPSPKPVAKAVKNEDQDRFEKLALRTVLGKVTAVMKGGVIVTGDDGVREEYILPPKTVMEEVFYNKLAGAVKALAPKYRVVLSYKLWKGKRAIHAVIGGRDPRDKSTVSLPEAKAEEDLGKIEIKKDPSKKGE